MLLIFVLMSLLALVLLLVLVLVLVFVLGFRFACVFLEVAVQFLGNRQRNHSGNSVMPGKNAAALGYTVQDRSI